MCKVIKKSMRDFLWEEVEERGGAHLVNWETMGKSLTLSGLELGNLEFDRALLGKWLSRSLSNQIPFAVGLL